ncbi:uncharacterized protein [Leptinotarsa decemlineata]|uniref:uncharacterized protein n=1 Tax=Leptinotarsa decemlineata TaxID=7539 RepID=UPI003D3090C1
MYVPMNTYVCFRNTFFHCIYNFIKHHIVMFKMCTYLCFVFGLLYGSRDLFYNPQCLLEMPATATKIFREPEKCDFCRNIANVDRIENISSTDFHSKYALLGKPVIVSDGMRDWSAQNEFSFEFFQRLYQNIHGKILSKSCQFFPYKTEFKNLREVFEMSKSRANLVPGEKPWYVGWSNCMDKAGQYLRKYYSKPYFLGNYSENIALSWIFMGGPGDGAQMHVDNVLYPSWQAQLKGKKLWKLAPPPECYNVCQNIEVLVQPGEIIVIDTNRWYHQTAVLSEVVSITIGSEFD